MTSAEAWRTAAELSFAKAADDRERLVALDALAQLAAGLELSEEAEAATLLANAYREQQKRQLTFDSLLDPLQSLATSHEPQGRDGK